MSLNRTVIRPQAGPQEKFLKSPADIVIYGGAAGGGKTYGLLLEPLRHVGNPKFGGVIFRRTYPEVTSEGGLWDVALELYTPLGAVPKIGDLTFIFPSGATLSFAHLQHEQDKLKYQGAQICFLAFDELTHFTESQVLYMMSRNRSTSGIRPYIRATCNPVAAEEMPGGWVAKLIEWWLDPETGFAIPERSGAIRWFIRSSGETIWAGTPEELVKIDPDSQPLSLTFIPAKLADNDILVRADPGYLAKLKNLSYVDRMRLLEGNWKIVASAGNVFKQEWFDIRHDIPDGGVMCRFWDFAATAKSMKSPDPDFTAVVLQRRIGRLYVVEDVEAGQWSPAEVDRQFIRIAQQDMIRAEELGCRYIVRWEVEPGSAGIRESRRLTAMLPGIDARGERPGTGDKITRALPYAAQCEAGNVVLRSARWNSRWLTHMHSQPMTSHDDIMDASVGSWLSVVSRVGSLMDFVGSEEEDRVPQEA
jgi:predicted phage terminase large subunit-like protein